MKRLALPVFLALAAACSPSSTAERAAAAEGAPATHPVSALKVIPLTVSTQAGEHVFTVEVAATEVEQEHGLMFRKELGASEGMIFPRRVPQVASFWMRNTPLPLDIIFIGPDGRILNIAANTEPYSLEPVTSAGPASAVLEIPGGRAADLGIVAGDSVQFAGSAWGK